MHFFGSKKGKNDFFVNQKKCFQISPKYVQNMFETEDSSKTALWGRGDRLTDRRKSSHPLTADSHIQMFISTVTSTYRDDTRGNGRDHVKSTGGSISLPNHFVIQINWYTKVDWCDQKRVFFFNDMKTTFSATPINFWSVLKCVISFRTHTDVASFFKLYFSGPT